MSVKSKGINAERDLVKKFWAENIPAIRVAGSGSSRFPSPDLLVGSPSKKIAIEVKITKENKKYFKKEEIEQLKEFCTLFGIEGWVAIKFNKNEWLFLPLSCFSVKDKSHCISLETLRAKGVSFEELVTLF